MNTLYAIILGFIQGLTEFIPVSSTAHLILAERFFRLPHAGLLLNASLHLGTACSLLIYFRKKLWSLLDISHTENVRMLTYLAIATIPAVIGGILFADSIEQKLSYPIPIAFSLISISIVFVIAERFAQHKKSQQVTIHKSILIGVAQSIALIPGVSRSGITIAAGMFLGLSRIDAAEFTFLLSIPIVLGAGGLSLIKAIHRNGFDNGVIAFTLVGMVSAFFVGYAVIAFLMQYFHKHTLYPFVIYRIGLGLMLLLV